MEQHEEDRQDVMEATQLIVIQIDAAIGNFALPMPRSLGQGGYRLYPA
jgi:hypothetical protein